MKASLVSQKVDEWSLSFSLFSFIASKWKTKAIFVSQLKQKSRELVGLELNGKDSEKEREMW